MLLPSDPWVGIGTSSLGLGFIYVSRSGSGKLKIKKRIPILPLVKARNLSYRSIKTYLLHPTKVGSESVALLLR